MFSTRKQEKKEKIPEKIIRQMLTQLLNKMSVMAERMELIDEHLAKLESSNRFRSVEEPFEKPQAFITELPMEPFTSFFTDFYRKNVFKLD